jgi:isopentenyldiphosphate isomerase
MDEIIDVLDEKTGEKTGETISKKEAHRTGVWHGAIHIIIVNKEHNKTLLQKRCTQKQLYPNTWDIAVGGHISAGESDLISAERELEEELGLNLSDYEIKFIEKVQEKLNNNGIISNEYVSIFVVYADIAVNNIVLQEEEVSEIKWCSKEELNDFIDQKIIIPHVREYEILNEILN